MYCMRNSYVVWLSSVSSSSVMLPFVFSEMTSSMSIECLAMSRLK